METLKGSHAVETSQQPATCRIDIADCNFYHESALEMTSIYGGAAALSTAIATDINYHTAATASTDQRSAYLQAFLNQPPSAFAEQLILSRVGLSVTAGEFVPPYKLPQQKSPFTATTAKIFQTS